MKTLAIARVNVLRMLRDKSNIFFVFIFPLALILLIGATFGGAFVPKLAVAADDAAGPLATSLLDGLDARADELEVVRLADGDEVADAVSRGSAQGGLVIPDDYDTQVTAGQDVSLGFVTQQSGNTSSLRTVVGAVLAEHDGLLRAARAVADPAATGGSGDDDFVARFDQAASLSSSLPVIGVEVTTDGDGLDQEFAGLGQFDLGASQQLMLFVFLTSLAGSAALIQTRQLGLATRMLSTPTRAGQVLLGEAAGRFGVALVQGIYIMAGTLLLFGVDWGAPVGALAILVLFSLVSSGAGMLMGAVFRNDSQASGVGVLVGLGLAALGGCMVPIEIFPPVMKTVAHFTPHAWALDGFAVLVRRDGGALDILPELGVLAAYAAVLLGLASWRLQRVLTH